MRLPLVKSWSKLHGLTLGQESIVTDMRMLYGRAHDALDNISTAVDQFRPDVNDPFVKHVLAVLAVRDSAAPLPALLSDVPMPGEAPSVARIPEVKRGRR